MSTQDDSLKVVCKSFMKTNHQSKLPHTTSLRNIRKTNQSTNKRETQLRTLVPAIFCPRLPPLLNGRIRPGSCSSSKSKYGSRCEFACDPGYQISGPIKTTCIDPGVWSEGHKSPRCVGTCRVVVVQGRQV